MCNLTFFYAYVVMTIIYAVTRVLASENGTVKERVKAGLGLFVKTGMAAVFGLLLASAVLLPIAFNYLNDPRMLVKTDNSILYPLKYYSKLPGMLISEGLYRFTCIGLSAPVLPALCLMFSKKNSIVS